MHNKRDARSEAAANAGDSTLGSENLTRIREALRAAVRLLEIEESQLIELPGFEKVAGCIEEVKESLPRRTRGAGRVDGLIDQVLERFDARSIHALPYVLSAAGFLVTSKDALGVLQVHDDFLTSVRKKNTMLVYNLFVGYKPHIDIVRELPLAYFEGPGYVAPVEDLLDWAGTHLYTARHASEAEDGAVGWLVEQGLRDVKAGSEQERYLQRLGSAAQYWSTGRLAQCLATWRDVVCPALTGTK